MDDSGSISRTALSPNCSSSSFNGDVLCVECMPTFTGFDDDDVKVMISLQMSECTTYQVASSRSNRNCSIPIREADIYL